MGIFRFAQLHRFFDMVYAHLYVGVMVVGVLWWGGKWQQDANLGPMYTPLTNLFEPNQKFQEAILSIIVTALTWFGLMDLNMRRRRRHTHGGLA